MRPRSTTSRLAGVLAASVLVLAACSDDGEDTTAAATDETSATDSAPEDETSAPEKPSGAKGDGTLTVGTLLPQTGDLAFLGPPEFAGVDVAIEEINAAGGVLGKPVKTIRGDSGDGTPNVAPGNTRDLIDGGSDVIVGAASSSVSLSVLCRPGASRTPPTSNSRRWSSRPSITRGGSSLTRAAASAIASGSPSRRTQISATTAAFSSPSRKSGFAARARSTKSATAS